MKRILSLKNKTAHRNKGSLKSAYRRGFSRGLALGLILLAAFIVLTGGLLYGQGGVDALFIDEKGTVKVQELEVTGTTRLGDAVTVEGATTLKKNLTVNGNAGIGTTAPKAALDIQQEERTDLEKHPKSVKGLYVTGNFTADKGVEFRHSNGSSGIGFGFNTIYATGSNTDQNLNLKPQESGKVYVQGDLNVAGATTIGKNLIIKGDLSATELITGNGSRIKIYIKPTKSPKEYIYLDDLVSLLVKIGRTEPPVDNTGWMNALKKTTEMWRLMKKIPKLVKTGD
jgi:hypothetical protein